MARVLCAGVVLCLICPVANGLSDLPDKLVTEQQIGPVHICLDDDDCTEEQWCRKRPGDCDGRGRCAKLMGDNIQCLDVWDPVCGCDGVTYSNACYAAKAAVNIDYLGECLDRCFENDECRANNEYCAKKVGDCDGEGRCQERPTICPTLWDPVCGCDGETYPNDCVAAINGVNVDYWGECVDTCFENDECRANNEYCAKEVGDCDGEGKCKERPEACPKLWDPVCGCDGETYPNDCVAAQHGVNIDYWGECVDTCFENDECRANNEYCAKKVGDCDGEGKCKERPEACPKLWDPVCGCDGETYPNDCVAAQHGVNVDYWGECDDTCFENDECRAANEFCAKHPGDCDGEGKCKPRPSICPLLYAPVCGCDGQTYANKCVAAMNGVNVDYKGKCADTCFENDECRAANEFCAKRPGDCDGEGKCRPRPELCSSIYAPVCGCDGQTYANRCVAAMNGVNVDYRGECVGTCFENEDCDDADEYCAKEVGDCDGQGKCEERPIACPYLWDPVCGCDGQTYANACLAAAAGVNVDYEGECVGVCFKNEDCDNANNEYCAKEVGDCDGQGKCEERPQACPLVWDPVCGCDGQTYDNECIAAVAGVNVDYEGECVGVCFKNEDCDDTNNEYCAKEIGDCDGQGKCEERPQICPLIWAPVCGCDGQTYGNACMAAAAGVNVDYEGECVGVCFKNEDCNDTNNEYCAKEVGDCDGQGKCEERPQICPLIWAPVCGCDGQTYGNACMAAAAGVNVDYEGECEPAYCWSNDMCANNEYCFFEVCELETGVCEPRPEICPDVWDPVCGCDGVTYSNACYAAMAGMSVDYEGECEPPYCLSNEECRAANEYCAKKVGDCDGRGKCEERPQGCPDVWDPVCGCDGKTYGNACEAAAAGVNVDYEGECEPAYCWSNDMCANNEYCFFEVCAAETGVCELRPEACPDVWDPVCGCDGVTYSNACYAAMAGMSVDYEGECEPAYCWSNDMCPNNEYCFFEVCALETGVCELRPEACPDVWDPVCGCDGVTYSNACYAAMAGMSVDYEGECEPAYCWSNDMCPNNEYCFFEVCAAETGVCELRPEACPDVWDPVCGCDGVTYSNACYAAMAGMSVDYEGVCDSTYPTDR